MYSLILVTALNVAADTPRAVPVNNAAPAKQAFAAPARMAYRTGVPATPAGNFEYGCCPTFDVELFLPCPPSAPCPPFPPSAPRGVCGPRVNTHFCPTPPHQPCPVPLRQGPAPCP
jgi:hypothetical protein